MGTDFFLSQKLTQCTMEVGWWKFLNYEVIFSLGWVALCLGGKNFRKFTFSGEYIAMHFWARLAIETRKWRSDRTLLILCIYYVTCMQFIFRTWSSSEKIIRPSRGNWTVVGILLYFFPSYFCFHYYSVSSSRPCIFLRERGGASQNSYGNLQFRYIIFH